MLGGPLVLGGQVTIRWRFTFEDGAPMRQEGVAWQAQQNPR